VLALPAYSAVKLSAIRAAPATTERAADWLRANAEPNDRVLFFPELDVPLLRRDEDLVFWGTRTVGRRFQFLPWARYQAEHEIAPGGEPVFDLVWSDLNAFLQAPVDYFDAGDFDLLVLEVFAENRTSAPATRARDQLREQLRLAERISPDSDPAWSDHPLGFQEETSVPNPSFTARVLQAEGTGPVIEIYRRRHAAGPRRGGG